MPEGPRHPAPMLLVLALRCLAFGWTLIIALVSGQIQRPVEAAVELLVTGHGTAWLTMAAVRRVRFVLHRHARPLTSRECDVAALPGNGYDNQEIATQLHIAVRTVTVTWKTIGTSSAEPAAPT